MAAWYQWATPPAAAMRPACVVPMQYFLCDRNIFAFTMDDTMPVISLQTSTIVLPVQMHMRKGLPVGVLPPGRLFMNSGYGLVWVLCPVAVLVVIKR